MAFKNIKKILAAGILLFTAGSLFAVDEYVSKLYKDIDVVFVEKSDTGLNDILQSNKDDKNYYLIENYAEKKIRRLIVINDYEFAMNAIIVVIENNLDNEEAVEMYSIIEEAYEVQLEYEAKKEEERQLELARIEGEKEKHRGEVDKEYVSAKTEQGKSVYVTGKETTLTSYYCDFSFGLVNFAITNESSLGFTGMNYGLSGNLNYVYDFDKFLGGIDMLGGFNFLPISSDGNEITMLYDLDFAAKFATKKISKNLFIRAGMEVLGNGKKDNLPITANVSDKLISPYVGLQLNKAKMGAGNITLGADYLLGTLWTDGYKAGVKSLVDIALPYAQLEKVNLNFHIGVKDILLLKDSGMENRASIIFAIGAENVNR